jgi:hypothetical protein
VAISSLFRLHIKKRPELSSGLSSFLAVTAGLPPSCRIHSGIAFAAIYRPVSARLKRNLCADAALGTYRRIHLPSGTAEAAMSATLLLLSSTALRATLGLVGVTFLSEELLLLNTEGKGTAAIITLQLFVGEFHWMTSFLQLLC